MAGMANAGSINVIAYVIKPNGCIADLIGKAKYAEKSNAQRHTIRRNS